MDAQLLACAGTPIVWKNEQGEKRHGVVESVKKEYVLVDGEEVKAEKILAYGVSLPGTWAEDTAETGVRGVVLGYRYADGTTAIKPDNGDPVLETFRARLVSEQEEVANEQILKRRAVAVVEAVCRSLSFASEAAKSQLEKLSLERPSQMRQALAGTKAGAAAYDGVSGTVAEAMKHTSEDGAVAALGDVARRFQVKASTTDFEALGRRLAAQLLSDKKLLEDAFARLLPPEKEVSTNDSDDIPLSRQLAKATVAFVSSPKDNAIDKEMGVKVVQVAGRPAFERAVATALRAADENSVTKVLEAADIYRGTLGADLMTNPEAFLSSTFFAGASFASSGVLDKSSQDYALDYLKKLAQGASLTETLTSALDDDRAVSGVQTALQSPAVAKLADMIASFDSDARAKHFAQRFKDADGILDKLADGWDLDASNTLRTLVQGNPAEKKALIDKANDAALGFFLQHLPAMPVPDLEIEKDGVLYQVSNLNLSNLKLVKRDVDVDFPLVVATSGEFAVSNADELLKKEQNDFFDDARLDEESRDRTKMLAIKARRVSAKLDKLQWRFKQTFFPYLEGSGYADVDVDEAAMLLEFAARQSVSQTSDEKKDNKPIVAATRCQVEIGHLELTIESHREGRLPVAWLLNAMSSLFREQVREYVRDSIESFLARQLINALVSLDDVIDGAWPLLTRLFPAALPVDTSRLEPCKEDECCAEIENGMQENNCTAARRTRALLREQRRHRRRQGPARSRLVRLTLDEPGPLGLELAVSNSKLTLRGMQPQGQAARFVTNRRLRLIEGSIIVAVDDVPLPEISGGIEAIVARVTAAERPKRITFELPLSQSSSVVSAAPPRKPLPTKVATALAVEKFELCPASKPDRPVASLGIKLRRHDALDEAVELAEAPRGTAVPVGAILVACTGAPRLCAPIGHRASPTSVGNAVKLCLQAAARSGRAFSINVAASPDKLIQLPSRPSDLLFQVAQTASESYFVLAGLSDVVASPLESAGAMLSDLITRINDERLPTTHGYAHDVGLLKQAVSDASAKKSTFSLGVKRTSTQDKEKQFEVNIIVTPASYTSKLGATFTRCQDTGFPKLKRFDGIPGPVAATCTAWKHLDLRPGLALVAIDNRRLDASTTSLSDLEALLSSRTPENDDDEKQRPAVFRQVEAYDELITRFATSSEVADQNELSSQVSAPESFTSSNVEYSSE